MCVCVFQNLSFKKQSVPGHSAAGRLRPSPYHPLSLFLRLWPQEAPSFCHTLWSVMDPKPWRDLLGPQTFAVQISRSNHLACSLKNRLTRGWTEMGWAVWPLPLRQPQILLPIRPCWSICLHSQAPRMVTHRMETCPHCCSHTVWFL